MFSMQLQTPLYSVPLTLDSATILDLFVIRFVSCFVRHIHHSRRSAQCNWNISTKLLLITASSKKHTRCTQRESLICHLNGRLRATYYWGWNVKRNNVPAKILEEKWIVFMCVVSVCLCPFVFAVFLIAAIVFVRSDVDVFVWVRECQRRNTA